MPVKHLLLAPLRLLCDALHPLYTCCASCGEIAYPGRGYLCASLKPDFAVDAVLLPASAGKGPETAAKALAKELPWLRRVHVARGPLPDAGAAPAGAGESLFSFPDLAEHFLVVHEQGGKPCFVPPRCGSAPRRVAPGALDFFTANGIPLLVPGDSGLPEEALRPFADFMAERGLAFCPRLRFARHLPALSRTCLKKFSAFYAELAQPAPAGSALFFAHLCLWAYAVGMAVPVNPVPAKVPPRAARPGPDRSLPAALQDKKSRRGPRRKLRDLLLSLHPATPGCGACRHTPPSLADLVSPEPAISFPVDIVYTWVNGDDPAHAARRAAWLPGQGKLHENALDPARFRDNEDLRYSLRSLEQFAPWARSVILVTDRQKPSWLKEDHPKIRIVDHSEIIPERFLPTFNSHVIEAYLHTIPGLAEHFIYMNDDFFLGRACGKNEFFTPNGLPLCPVDWRWRRRFGYWYTKTPHAMSYYNTLDILRHLGLPTHPRCVTAHGPYAQTRTNAADAFALYQEHIEGFSGNRFRSTNELAMYCHALPLWAYGQKRLVPCDERHTYVQTDRADRLAYYQGLLKSRRDKAAPLFFCINDVRDNSEATDWLEDFHRLLTTCFPLPSSYENDRPSLEGAPQPLPDQHAEESLHATASP